ncbi:flap endonuclease Xni [Paraferrimonas haliotis]|uniref:flap endonuclease Xni n=1 Tax=Paraferrimonas haliotis TaxID=2013866 RepID=UPI000BA985FC|nr:flap endonuclease Xni [Paraferrimonas haliotis]
MGQPHLVIVDALNLVRRMHAALPEEPPEHFCNRVQRNLLKLQRGLKASHLMLVWDGDRNSWRKQLYPNYKAGRSPMPASLSDNLTALITHCEQHGYRSITADQEADDAIASIALKILNNNVMATIVSTDKGFCQLLGSGVRLWDHFNQKPIDEDTVLLRFELASNQLTQLWALAGDSGNKIPGVKGIGSKTAVGLLQRYGSVKAIYQHLDELPTAQRNKLTNDKEAARISYQLAKLKTNNQFQLRLSDFRVKDMS